MLLAEKGAVISDQFARRLIAPRWYLLDVEFRVNVKLSVVVCAWVRVSVALLASQEPDTVKLGDKLTNS